MLRRPLVLLALGVLLSGCATALKGSTQEVRVGVNGPPSAACTASNGSGSWTVKAPGTVKVERSSGALSINCEAEGFKSGTRVVSSEFNGATVGNVLLGGLIGVAIDAASGANYSYPEQVVLTLEPACPEGDATCIARVVEEAAAQAEAERKARAAAILASQAGSTGSAGTTTSTLSAEQQADLQASFDTWLAEHRDELLKEVADYAREHDLHDIGISSGSVASLVRTRVVRATPDGWVVDVTYYLRRASPSAAYQSSNETDRFELRIEGGVLTGITLGT